MSDHNWIQQRFMPSMKQKDFLREVDKILFTPHISFNPNVPKSIYDTGGVIYYNVTSSLGMAQPQFDANKILEDVGEDVVNDVEIK